MNDTTQAALLLRNCRIRLYSARSDALEASDHLALDHPQRMRTDRLCGELADFIANVEKLIFLLDGTMPRQDTESDIEYTSADSARVPTPPGASFVGDVAEHRKCR
jgi:hypothetical protein